VKGNGLGRKPIFTFSLEKYALSSVLDWFSLLSIAQKGKFKSYNIEY